jgi:hypothetical protein
VTGGASVSVSHTWATNGTFTVSVTATDKDAGTSAPATASVTVAVHVVADAGGPYTVAEGASLVVDASASVTAGPGTFDWDVNGDGTFGDASGVSPTLTGAQLAALGLGDGPATATIELQVTDGLSTDTTTTGLTITNVAPTAAVTNVPATIVEGTPATLTFGATDVAAADQAAGFTFVVDWGDGTGPQSVTGGASVSVSHTWATDGTFTVSVTATDKDGGTSAPATASVTVVPLVVADAGGPYTVAEGGSLTLDGTASAAGPAATYDWDVNGDGTFGDATGPTPTLTAAQLESLGLGDGPGSATITLRVTEGPSVDTDTAALTTTNTPPVAAVSLPPGIVEATAATVTFTATDPSAADQAASFAFAIDWGDGTPVQPVTGGASVSVPHTWATDGTFTVSVTATDKDGGTSAPATAVATVVPLVIAEADGPVAVAEGSDLFLDGTGSSAGPTATYSWDIDGDGTFGDAVGPAPTVTYAQLIALGLDDGPRSLTVTLLVTEGPSSDTDDGLVAVLNTAPTVSIDAVPPPPIEASTAVDFTFGATDPSPTDQAAGFDFTVDWGDGTPTDTVSGPTGTVVPHVFPAAGTFTVSVTATDQDNGTSTPATTSVTVDPHVGADAGGPYSIDEGDNLELDASASVAGPTAVFEWDLDGDGQFDDATGAQPVLTPDELDPLGLADGPAGPLILSVRVTEGPTVDTADATFTIANVAPVATVDVLGAIVAGATTTVKVGAVDPSPTDMAAQFEYRIDWEGDGTVDLVVTGPSDPPVTHVYASAGDVGLTVVAVDKDGDASPTLSRSLTVSPATPTGPGTPGTPGTGTGTGTGGTGTGTGTGSSGSGLPRTGTDPRASLAVAFALVAVGALLAAAGRRRGAHFARRRA